MAVDCNMCALVTHSSWKLSPEPGQSSHLSEYRDKGILFSDWACKSYVVSSSGYYLQMRINLAVLMPKLNNNKYKYLPVLKIK